MRTKQNVIRYRIEGIFIIEMAQARVLAYILEQVVPLSKVGRRGVSESPAVCLESLVMQQMHLGSPSVSIKQ